MTDRTKRLAEALRDVIHDSEKGQVPGDGDLEVLREFLNTAVEEANVQGGDDPVGYVGLTKNAGAVFARVGDPQSVEYAPWIPVYTSAAPHPTPAPDDDNAHNRDEEAKAAAYERDMVSPALKAAIARFNAGAEHDWVSSLEDACETYMRVMRESTPAPASGEVTDEQVNAAHHAYLTRLAECGYAMHVETLEPMRAALEAATRARQDAPTAAPVPAKVDCVRCGNRHSGGC